MLQFNRIARGWRDRSGRSGAVVACLWLVACHDGAAPAATAPPVAPAGASEAKGASDPGVTLTPDQVDKLGLATQPATRADYRDEASGYGVVLGHELIAQAAAELASAQATERQSRAALERARKLEGTPGAVSVDVVEAAAQKAAVDAAALTLTQEKLSGALGMNPPWKTGGRSTMLRELASGRLKLVRATFPLGTLAGDRPSSLRAARLGAIALGGGWTLHTLWDAPADAAVPGRSYFALLPAGDAGEGERLRVWAPVGSAEAGVLIPGAAAVLHDGRYWCFVEKTPGRFARVEIDITKPLGEGYFVSRGVAPGDTIVTAAAGLLLAMEAGAGAEPD